MDNNLIGPNGIFLMDNVLWKGELYVQPLTERAQVFLELSEFIHKDPRVSQVGTN